MLVGIWLGGFVATMAFLMTMELGWPWRVASALFWPLSIAVFYGTGRLQLHHGPFGHGKLLD